MSSDNLSRKHFFERAKFEADRYGEDPWVFLRELVQNSRDAGADRIEVDVLRDENKEQVTFKDNGSGMSLEHFEQYLLRLYSSSKEEDQSAVGFFGVGFWAVLLFQPDSIMVSSAWQGATRAFTIDCQEFNISESEGPIIEKGTHVTLTRCKQNGGQKPNLCAIVRERLIYYTAHVRSLAGGRSPALICNGEILNSEFAMPEFMGSRLKHKAFEGVIGFGRTPSVRIYKGGILVRDLTSLEEVIPRRKIKTPYTGPGLHPVIRVEMERVQVLMNRQRIFEDNFLHDFVTLCEKKLLEMHQKLIRHFFPMNLRNTLFRFFGGLMFVRPGCTTMTTLALLFVASMIAGWFIPMSIEGFEQGFIPDRGKYSMPIDQAFQNWQGSRVEGDIGENIEWDFRYEGPENVLFRIGTLDRFDPIRGFYPQPHSIKGLYPILPPDDGRPSIRINMKISGTRQVNSLPIPIGNVIVPDSLIFNGKPIPVLQNNYGEPVIKTPGSGTLNYYTFNSHEPLLNQPIKPISHTWPELWVSAIEEIADQPVAEKVERLSSLIRQEFKYSEDPSLSELFRNNNELWLDKVMQARSGDCDVLNGLLVVLLREAGIEAYLSLGVVGRNGVAAPILHAWVRYYDQRWLTVDLTMPEPSEIEAATNPESIAIESQASASDEPVETSGSTSRPVFTPPPRIKKPVLWWWTLLLLIPAALIWRRFRGRPPKAEPDYIEHLFLHYFSHAQNKDPLQLKYRPIFSLVGTSRKLSLYELEKKASKQPLFGGSPKSPLIPELSGKAVILDQEDHLTRKLDALTPSVVRLDDMEQLMMAGPLHPVFVRAESLINRLDKKFKIHQLPDSDQFMEAPLPFRDRSRGQHHVLLGEQHKMFLQCTELFEQDESYGVFEAARLLLEKTTFLLVEKDQFLRNLARTMEEQHG